MKYKKEEIKKMIDLVAELKQAETNLPITDEELEKRAENLKSDSSLELLELAFDALFSDSTEQQI